MSDRTGIGWTQATWNPTTGCDRVSPGCDRCYAMSLAPRLQVMSAAKGRTDYQRDGDPATSGPGFGLMTYDNRLDQPIRWTRPRMIFVNSMSDLFHNEVPDEFIARVFAVMAHTPRHTFQILTKRHGRMRSLLSSLAFQSRVQDMAYLMSTGEDPAVGAQYRSRLDGHPAPWPLPNVWLGVSAEDQHWADIRVPGLAETPAAVRFISAEPLLGPIDLTAYLPKASESMGGGVMGYLSQGGRCDFQPGDFPGHSRHVVALCRQCTNGRRISWVIVGGESGPGARPVHPGWVRDLRDQCATAGVAMFFKQWGAHAPVAPADAVADDTIITPAGQTTPWSDVENLTVETRRASYVMRSGSPKANGNTLDGITHEQYPRQAQEATP